MDSKAESSISSPTAGYSRQEDDDKDLTSDDDSSEGSSQALDAKSPEKPILTVVIPKYDEENDSSSGEDDPPSNTSAPNSVENIRSAYRVTCVNEGTACTMDYQEITEEKLIINIHMDQTSNVNVLLQGDPVIKIRNADDISEDEFENDSSMSSGIETEVLTFVRKRSAPLLKESERGSSTSKEPRWSAPEISDPKQNSSSPENSPRCDTFRNFSPDAHSSVKCENESEMSTSKESGPVFISCEEIRQNSSETEESTRTSSLPENPSSSFNDSSSDTDSSINCKNQTEMSISVPRKESKLDIVYNEKPKQSLDEMGKRVRSIGSELSAESPQLLKESFSNTKQPDHPGFFEWNLMQPPLCLEYLELLPNPSKPHGEISNNFLSYEKIWETSREFSSRPPEREASSCRSSESTSKLSGKLSSISFGKCPSSSKSSERPQTTSEPFERRLSTSERSEKPVSTVGSYKQPAELPRKLYFKTDPLMSSSDDSIHSPLLTQFYQDNQSAVQTQNIDAVSDINNLLGENDLGLEPFAEIYEMISDNNHCRNPNHQIMMSNEEIEVVYDSSEHDQIINSHEKIEAVYDSSEDDQIIILDQEIEAIYVASKDDQIIISDEEIEAVYVSNEDDLIIIRDEEIEAVYVSGGGEIALSSTVETDDERKEKRDFHMDTIDRA
ncbi:unnamed protein product [Hermetia illucens]|uniref:Uncharacterized protein n=1 Tax=Hermetia illucens TaxID=343691 RepID=A0A7R8Z5D6_HERIL|nr:unnamed protein product [Hermetia illucens]